MRCLLMGVFRSSATPFLPRFHDLQAAPLSGRPAFDLHSAQARILRPPLVWNQVVQVRQARSKRRLASTQQVDLAVNLAGGRRASCIQAGELTDIYGPRG